MVRFVAPAVAAVLVASVAVPAWATNTEKTRVAPEFWGTSCIVEVDRSTDPVAALPIAIPFEDYELTMDELPDSRRFQFFALCEDHPVEQDLPLWVNMDDAQRSLDTGIIDELPASADVLATAPEWQQPGHDGQPGSCVVPINTPDDRMPITCEATAEGIVWDTTGVPAGAYVIRSYTFEPEKNLWARRPGLVRIVDGDDDPGPAVTLTDPRRKGTTYEEPGFIVTGCFAGAPGTTVRIEYSDAASVVAGDESAWTLAAELTPDEGTFEYLFVPPQETVYLALYLRAVATDPDGRTWTAHADHELVVLPDCGEGFGSEYASPADGCGIVGDWMPPDGEVAEQPSDCDFMLPDSGDDGTDDTADDGTGDDTAGSGSTGGGGDDDGTGGSNPAADGSDGDTGGCSCKTGGRAPTPWPALALLLLVVRRRRGAQRVPS